jgi:dienelactone hydrolase
VLLRRTRSFPKLALLRGALVGASLASSVFFTHAHAASNLPTPLLSSIQRVAVTIDGQPVHLQMRVYKPPGDGKFPTLVFNHGSTGYGIDTRRFKQPVDAPAVGAFFVQRGWVVVIPARRGRAGSDGEYDEGFSAIRSLGYSCIPSRALAGADRALRDIEAAVGAIVKMPFVDASRLVMGGESRGGALSIAYAGAHPAEIKTVINFVGGWLGWPCPNASSVNEVLMNRGASYPGESLWLYGENDSYYSVAQSREGFDAFIAAGGKASFHEFVVPAKDGHWLPSFPALWTNAVEANLRQAGLPVGEQEANPSIERTSYSQLRWLPAAAQLKR